MDAAGYLILLHIYTAHMSGNSVTLGIAAAQLRWTAVVLRLWPVVTFVLGLILCAIINEIGARRHLQSVSSISLGVEAIFLGAFVFLAPRYAGNGLKNHPFPDFFFLAALLTMAMGVQTPTLTRLGGLTLYTTYVTGTLAKFSDSIGEYLGWFYDRTHGRFFHRIGKVILLSPRKLNNSALMIALWLGYIAGAICGALAKHRWQSFAILVPLGLLGVIIALDLFVPVAPPREKAQ